MKLLQKYQFFSVIEIIYMDDFLIQFKKIMKIFYYLSEDLEYEDLDQIKKQCIFILK